eukprot:gene41043-50545_t
MFAHLAIQYADPTGSINIPYQFGRVDTTSCSAGSNRLPEAQNAKQAIKQVFGTQMGFSLAQTVTLFGGHTIGHVHFQNSGYGVTPDSPNLQPNAWDSTPHQFDSQYYSSIIDQGWSNKPVPGDSNPRTKNIWSI